MSDIYQFDVNTITGESTSLSQYKGKVLLIVNTASKCGFTPQYEGMETIYKDYKNQGFEVLAFPCNQFGSQEPGGSEEIKEFCSLNYKSSFPLFEKIDVNGKNAHPLYKYLTHEKPGLLGSEMIKWNFTKFLIGKDGKPIKRYAPKTKPESLGGDIEKALAI
ncbi:glutathione peroxidase [bacterium K02(2017)]|nr:glutathione peroxidase [bacterium K02(2017)]